MKKFILIIIVISIVGCSQDPGLLNQKWLVGINDSAIYHLNKDGSIGAVQVHSMPGEFIILNRDTIDLGDKFSASFFLQEKYEIVIFRPTREIIKSDDKKKEEPLSYEFKTLQRGIFDLEGEIKYDSSTTPFKFKFIVQ